MSFNIVLMQNKDELNKIRKNPITISTLNGTLKSETDLIDPVILIERSSVPTNVNYLRIAEFNRYYFITDIRSIRNNLWEITCHCDVLYTYAQDIVSHKAIIARQENDWNLYLDDGVSFKVYSNPRVQQKNFPSGFTGSSYVLIMVGANYEEPESNNDS